MKDNTAIVIEQVDNGFVVSGAPIGDYGRQVCDAGNRYVFQSMAGLCRFLEMHFDHRDGSVEGDLDMSPAAVIERFKMARGDE